jgi:glycosyltransferase involved in cell wall biosynthesis
MKTHYLSVVIPAYNEETNIRLGALDQVERFLVKQTYSWEVILVDDGSTDATPTLLEAFAKNNRGFHVLHNQHQGKAASVITGILSGQGEIIVFSDLDQATPIRELANLLPWFSRGFDVVIGSRNSKREGAPLLRLIMARGFMLLRGLILGLKGITDTQCGFKGFKKHVAREIFGKLALYGKLRAVEGSAVTAGFDIELLYLAKKLGYSIKEVAVEWHYVETRRVNPLKDSWQGFLDIVKIRINALKGVYI